MIIKQLSSDYFEENHFIFKFSNLQIFKLKNHQHTSTLAHHHTNKMNVPQPTEHNSYFKRYLDQCDGTEFFDQYDKNTRLLVCFLESLPVEKHTYAYAEGKWTILQLLRHIIDCERVFSYRALVAARGDSTVLPSFDEDGYAAAVACETTSMEEMLEEFTVQRLSNRFLFEHMSEEQSCFTANVNGDPLSARAIAFILIGHVNHHLKVMQERYVDMSKIEFKC
jgi:uncharacterized damage-inducible protein DinB